MSDYAHAINQHYGQAELCAKILAALRAAGKDLDALTRDDLATRQRRAADAAFSDATTRADLCARIDAWATG